MAGHAGHAARRAAAHRRSRHRHDLSGSRSPRSIHASPSGSRSREVLRFHLGHRQEGPPCPALSNCSSRWASAMPSNASGRSHQMSGGQCQRVMITPWPSPAIPKLLIADGPTTALDVTIQKQILDLPGRASGATRHVALIAITHNIGVVETADRVIVSIAATRWKSPTFLTLFTAPTSPYTRARCSRRFRERPRHSTACHRRRFPRGVAS